MRAALRMPIALRPIEESDAEMLVRWENWSESAYFLYTEKACMLATKYDREMDSLHPQHVDQEAILIRRDGTPFGLLRLRPQREEGVTMAWMFMSQDADYSASDVRKGFRNLVKELADRLRVPVAELARRVDGLMEDRAILESRLAERHGRDSTELVNAMMDEADPLPGGGSLIAASVDLPEGADLAALGDRVRDRLGSGAAILHVRAGNDKAAFLAVVTDDWITRGLRAGDLVSAASRATGSGGGGKPHLARGGVGDPAKVEAALEQAARHAHGVATGESP